MIKHSVVVVVFLLGDLCTLYSQLLPMYDLVYLNATGDWKFVV